MFLGKLKLEERFVALTSTPHQSSIITAALLVPQHRFDRRRSKHFTVTVVVLVLQQDELPTCNYKGEQKD